MSRFCIKLLCACAAIMLLGISSQAQEGEYPPAEYSLDLLTEEGHFCYPYLLENTSYMVVTCGNVQRDPWTNWRTVPYDLNDFFQPYYMPDRPYNLQSSFGMPIPYGVFGEDRVLGSDGMMVPSPIRFFHPGSVDNETEIAFESNGTGAIYMMAGDHFCAVKDMMMVGGNETVMDVIACDQRRSGNATKFLVRPRGWAWGYKRIELISAQTKGLCGNVFFQDDAPIVCPKYKKGSEVKTDMNVNLLGTNYLLPMRSNAKFGIQTWIESQIALTYWRTDKNGQVTAAAATPGDGWEQWGFTLESKNESSYEEKPIEIGEQVWMKSTYTGKYCKVYGDHSKLVCKSSKQGLENNPKAHTFTYNEMVPTDN